MVYGCSELKSSCCSKVECKTLFDPVRNSKCKQGAALASFGAAVIAGTFAYFKNNNVGLSLLNKCISYLPSALDTALLSAMIVVPFCVYHIVLNYPGPNAKQKFEPLPSINSSASIDSGSASALQGQQPDNTFLSSLGLSGEFGGADSPAINTEYIHPVSESKGDEKKFVFNGSSHRNGLVSTSSIYTDPDDEIGRALKLSLLSIDVGLESFNAEKKLDELKKSGKGVMSENALTPPETKREVNIPVPCCDNLGIPLLATLQSFKVEMYPRALKTHQVSTVWNDKGNVFSFAEILDVGFIDKEKIKKTQIFGLFQECKQNSLEIKSMIQQELKQFQDHIPSDKFKGLLKDVINQCTDTNGILVIITGGNLWVAIKGGLYKAAYWSGNSLIMKNDSALYQLGDWSDETKTCVKCYPLDFQKPLILILTTSTGLRRNTDKICDELKKYFVLPMKSNCIEIARHSFVDGKTPNKMLIAKISDVAQTSV